MTKFKIGQVVEYIDDGETYKVVDTAESEVKGTEWSYCLAKDGIPIWWVKESRIKGL